MARFRLAAGETSSRIKFQILREAIYFACHCLYRIIYVQSFKNFNNHTIDSINLISVNCRSVFISPSDAIDSSLKKFKKLYVPSY